ncbi:Ig-like domain-containing protein, partial [Vibrio sp. WZ-1]|uniref:Ig-like domain-containing protein n=1 Tax=Vibrio sp. WZ-1 TaxID=3454501 RepID=UPI003F86D1F5
MDRTSLVSYQEQVVVIGLDGQLRILSEGSQPSNGEIIVERVSQSELKVGLVKDEQSTDISDDIAQIIETLESGQDPTQLSEEFATAAGTANGSSYQLTATLERSASEILAATDFQTSGLQDLGVSQTQTLSLLEAYLNFNQVISSASGNPDTLAPSVPTVVITEDSNNDGSLENNEIDGLVDVLVTLPANAEVGDTLSVTGQPDRVITQNDLDNGVTLQYPVPAEGETLTVVATITDQAGNTSEPGQDAVTVPVNEAPTASIDLDPIVVGDDNVINQAEATGQVTLTGSVGGEVVEGDTVQLKLGDNLLAEVEVIKLADGNLGFSADVDASALAGFNDQSVTASVTITDGAGNAVTATDTETYQVDVDAPTASIDLDPIVVGGDNTINEAESTGKVTLSGTVGGDVKIGDTVTLALGENLLTTVTVIDLGNDQLGFSVDVDASDLVGFDGKSVTASVTVTDEAGNSVEKSDTETYLVDVDAPTASIDLDPIVVGDDNVINQAEATGQVTLTGTVGGEVVEGDTVQLKLGDNLLAEVEVIKLADGKLGFSADVDASKLVGVDGQAITASVTITDGAGNAVTA